MEKPAEKKADKEKKPDATDTAIASASANDGEVKTAKAKVQLAEAELAKAKQAVTLRVLTLKAQIEKLEIETNAWKSTLDTVNKGIGH